MKEIINLITDSRTQQRSSINQNNNHKINTLELDDFCEMYDKHLTHMRLLEENYFFASSKKDEVLENIDEVYQMITEMQSNKRENNVHGEGITYANNKVS